MSGTIPPLLQYVFMAWCLVNTGTSLPLLLRVGGCHLVIKLRPERSGFESRRGRDFFLLHRVQTGSGAYTASYPMDTGGLSMGVKRPGRESNSSPQSSAKCKNAWSYTSTFPYVFMTWCLVKHRNSFIFTFFSGVNFATIQFYLRQKNMKANEVLKI